MTNDNAARSASGRPSAHAPIVRVAVLCDIHGNLPALEAVLDEVRAARVDRIVMAGDIFPGPLCRDVLARLLALDVPVDFLYGNCEVGMLAAAEGRNPYALPDTVQASLRWCAEDLQPEERERVAGWPKTVRFNVPPLGPVLFCHGTPRDENEIFTRLTPDEAVAAAFEGIDAAVVVCGHTHMQFDRRIGGVRVVNAGSVGMPFGPPGAYWLLLGPDVELRRTEYDLNGAGARLRAAAYPDAGDFVERYVLHPPSEQQMLDLFSPRR